MKKSYAVAIGAFVIVLAGVAGWSVLRPGAAPDMTPIATAAQAEGTAAPAPAADKAPDTVKDFSIGQADAKVEVVEYASFTCPHCKHFHDTVWPQIKSNYIDTGKVHFTLREVYFDKLGLWGAMIARCGGTMRYYGIADMLFDQQSDWAHTEDAGQAVEKLKLIGRAAGMDDATMDACLKDQDYAKALVAHYQANFTADGVEGTPTFFINGVKHSNMSYDDFKALLDAELAK